MKRNRRFRRIRLTSVQLIILFYLCAVVLATSLLSLPFAHRDGMEWSFIDALFTAVSAISVTGLTVVNTAETFNEFGYFILAFVLQFGGIGIMTLGTFIWLLAGKRIGLRERQLIMTDQNRSTLSGLVRLMREILSLIVIIEAIGALILSIYFLNYFDTWQEAVIQGIFASVSATTNAGFDITGQSMIPFANDYFVQFINILLLILGAIGFPVLLEVKEYLSSKNGKYQFSLFTKLTTSTFFILVVIGTVFIWLIEWNHFYKDKSWHEAFFYSLFQSVTTRNGGLATMDVSLYTEPTQLLLSTLMFIGASPSSVGGGIRTTTFAIIILSILTFAKGNQTIKVFKRELIEEDIIKSFVVFSVAIIICGSATIGLMVIESFPLMPVIFEVSSAFGTTGLSMGITPELSTPGKVIVILLMFIGRVGILSFLFIIRGKIVKETYHYPKEHVIIG
ncbi:TrkH family potassium uptake protein [Pseudalkalibacillus salsuginis]|uniref:TrkH family potassium uptake protein n=1 Tax=Pseudalkalibacillus salsuginis TaxID=2910972 RepID=UPI001F319FCD|nr:TrkH family potassium uptake protein [Pseudalkalibacillus salsuginis]MCF6411004.1 TrkH family potassium uptake protein [Pseudalkalibacillus salsuginis]